MWSRWGQLLKGVQFGLEASKTFQRKSGFHTCKENVAKSTGV